MRTLNGKIVQHQLSQYYVNHQDQENAPIPAKVSYHHFLDESYHFNSSTIIGHDIVKCLKKPTQFEKLVTNMAIKGCQKDHFNFNCSVNGIFWYEPAIFSTIFKILKSPIFNLENVEAINMMEQCFCRENQGVNLAFKTHNIARESYQQYLAELDFLTEENRSTNIMKKSTINHYLKENTKRLQVFKRGVSNYV